MCSSDESECTLIVRYSQGLYPCDRRASISTHRTCFSEIDFTMVVNLTIPLEAQIDLILFIRF